ncbi:ATPase AAA [Reticulibacter mediterranei]|uniref:ATPase AAA n=1 Tax=Reticulibacter mediterranei TaxID=2778369 RepID=A0A8J3N2I4_9CHLR|nr:CDC48 family AAA ATPase [Reticulibacter mediterranei]GHO93518.1 ATPase AAA [Reticulibacter mediterranei]
MKDVSIQLKVVEAHPRDVGRGIARVDPEVMERLSINDSGEVIGLKGKRETVARIMPTFPELRGQGVIQIDGIIRENAQIGINEQIKLTRMKVEEARKVRLSPLTFIGRTATDNGYLSRQLAAIPAIAGDRVQTTFLGAKKQDFRVVDTVPTGAVLLTSQTSITIAGEGKATEARLTYEDIGGLGDQVRRIREMIELPLRFPQVFARLGIDPPKGVLLHGPPGCGKTLIAKVIANETDATFLQISGPEIMHKFYGESEEHLRNVFEEAKKKAPSILFLDELDAIAPKREELGGEKQVERRVVGQLLALMDGLKERGQVIIIGATNLPNILDPALRRPGRFDREIVIPIPDKHGRFEILTIHTRGMPFSDDVDMERLAFLTHGFVGADLGALTREAAIYAIRRLMPCIDFEREVIPVEALLALEVTMDDFLNALREVEPSAIREFFTEIPDIGFADIGGLEQIKRVLLETVKDPLYHPAVYAKAHTRPAKGIIVSGEPGTGKTLLAKGIAKESEVNFIAVSGPELLSKYIGESERGVREVFKKARQAAPCILFFDEIESIVPQRGKMIGDQVTERVVTQFLTEMDGIEELKGVTVLASTNRLDLIDPAILRPGRFDFVLELPKPDMKAREAIFRVHIRGKPLAKEVALENLARETDGLVGADIASICQKASLLAIREFLESKEEDLEHFVIEKRHFMEAMEDAISLVNSRSRT